MADSSLPLVCGVPTLRSRRSNPASLAKRHARSFLARRPVDMLTSDDMLSVRHSCGTPPMNLNASRRQASRSSVVRVAEYVNLRSRE